MTRSIVYGPGVDLDFGNNKLTNLADGVAADDAATVGQLGGGGGAVSSVFTRTGAVTAQTGDYTPAQVGAQPVDSDLTAIAALSTTSFGRSLLELANSAALLAAAGADAAGAAAAAQAASQPLDSDLTAIAGLSPTNDDVVQRKAGAWTNRSMAQLLADLAALGTTFQPLDSDLTAIAALTTTSYGRSLLEAADAAALRTLAGLVIGTNVQAYDADLAAIAGLTSAADKLPYFTGSGTAAVADFTSAARSVLDDTTVAAMRATLGVPAAVGGSEWTVVTKASDESVASSTTLQNDDELFFTAASGTAYEIQLFIIYVAVVGGATPDMKLSLGEDATLRGSFVTIDIGSNDAAAIIVTPSNQVASGGTPGTASTNRVLLLLGAHVGAGGTFRFQWAQNTSGLNPTTVKAGSVLRYRAVA